MSFKFAGHFRKNMLILACAMGLLIALLTPVTYLILSIEGLSREAEANSCYLANIVAENMFLGSTGQDVLDKIEGHNLDGINAIKLYNNRNQIIGVKEVKKEQVFEVMNHTIKPYSVASLKPITIKNIPVGYVEVLQNTDILFLNASILLTGFGGLGIISGILLYKFPTNIVNKSEERILQIMMKLEQLSYYDMLTNLPNRVMLDKSLMNILENAIRTGTNVGLFFLDLDRFKLINDTLGHAYGDILLKGVAERLRNHQLPHEIIARQGGDEFIIVIPDFSSLKELENRAIEIIASLSLPFEICERQFTVTTSLGVSIYPDDGRDIKTLIKHADLAMYMAKEQGKNKYCFYSAETRPAVMAL